MASRVKVYEEKLVVPTYTVGPPAKNPCILIEGHTNIYPYTLMDDIFKGRVEKAYRSLTLENEYLRIRVFPELGGHIWSAYDKVSREEMFYLNDVVKPGLILLRGSWCAYGMEFNFPCGHTVTTMSEIDSYMRANDDGSGSIFVGDVEMVSRMKWLVEIRLFPGEANFRTRVRLMNGTEVARRYYFWANSAVPATEGFQFVSPATESNPSWSHGTQPFPIQNGVDKSWYKNHHHSVDLFTVNSREDYFGYYDHDRQFGVAHIAPWYKIRGKKFFTWGTGDDGLIWTEMLSDSAGPYIEVQAGPFPTQSDFGMLQPHTTNTWEAMWYPVRGTGAFTFANEYAALRLETKASGRKQKTVSYKLNANRNLRKAKVRIRVAKNGDWHTIYNRGMNLVVRKTVCDEFKAAVGDNDLEFKIIDAKGVHLLTCIHKQKKPKPKPKPKEEYVPGGVYGTSLEGLFQSGYSFERYNNVTAALQKYSEAIEKDPLFSMPLIEMGKIHIYQGHYERAAEKLEKTLQRSPQNSDARYYRGVALRRMGRLDEAIAEFQQMSLDNRTAALGYYKIGQIQMLKGNYIDASELFEEAHRLNPDDLFTELMVPVSWRKRGRKRGPMQRLKALKEKDPTNVVVQNEIRLLSKATKGLNARAAAEESRRIMRDNPPSYIELALCYGKLGLINDAVDVLKRYVKTIKTPDTMLWYYLGYFLRQQGKTAEGNRYYRKASRMKQDYVFPNRLKAYEVLDDAVKVNRKDEVAWYALGNMLASRRRIDDAVLRWERCEKLKSKNAVVYRNLGLVLFKARNKPKEAVKKYRKAIKLDPYDRELYWELDQVYAKLGMDKERVRTLRLRPMKLRMDMKTNVRLADAYFNLGKFDKSLRVLFGQEFWPWEGGLFFRHLYMWSCLYKADAFIEKREYDAALEWIGRAGDYPENIKIRKPKRRMLAPILYYRGLVYEKMGQKKKARQFWQHAASEQYSKWIMAHTSYALYKGKSLKKLHRHAKAKKLFEKLIKTVKGFEGEDSARYWEVKGLTEAEMGQLGDAYASLSKSLRLLSSNITVKRTLKEIQDFMDK